MEQSAKRSFKSLLVWQQAMKLAKEGYLLTKRFPKKELYGLTSQIRRAAASVPANIAEGSGRGTKRDYVNFLRIAQGSLRELETYLLLAIDLNFMPPEIMQPPLQQTDSVARLLNRLIQALEKPSPSPLTP